MVTQPLPRVTAFEGLGIRALSRLTKHGSLQVRLPSGTGTNIGSGLPQASLELNDYSALGKMFRSGLTGFAEAYMDAEITTSDLPGLLSWGAANQAVWFEHSLSRATLPIRRVWQRVRPESRHPKVQTMNDHYNLGNDFYSTWLDDTMTYSSARFASPDQTLADAQHNKYRTIADHARLEPGMRVLEIGCGWGGFAEYAAGVRECEVVAVTLSEAHAAYATERLSRARLSDRTSVEIRDFSDVTGEYDAVVSIEMIESVDESVWPSLFSTIARSLRQGAMAVMQVITITDAEWSRYRTRTDFIRQYIFPGGQLPAPRILRQLASQAGLSIEQVETFGTDYARTLGLWRDRFEAAWPEMKDTTALDERFHRMWDLYLSLCQVGFRMGRIDVQQWSFAKSFAS